MQEQKNKISVIFTGGHGATTALAVIEEIKSRGLPWKIYWIGAKNAIEGKSTLTLEYRTLPTLGVTFLPLIMGRLQRRFTLWTIPSLIKIPLGLIHALILLIRIRPIIVLSFGGYSAFPVVLAAKFLGITVIIHEQTAAAGRANLASVKFADKIALARPESKSYFPTGKTVLTGNPTSRKMFMVKPNSKLGKMPLIFVTGGSRGSQNINEALEGILPIIQSKHKVVHQTGEIDFAKYSKLKSINYDPITSIEADKMPHYFEKADIIISRAGANTVSDILAARRPAILIPLPISYLDEQTKNAGIAEKAGFAVVLSQKDLTPKSLLKEIEKVVAGYDNLIKKAESYESPDKNAAEKLFYLLNDYIK